MLRYFQNAIYSDYQKILDLLKITIYKIFIFVNTINFVGYIYMDFYFLQNKLIFSDQDKFINILLNEIILLQ